MKKIEEIIFVLDPMCSWCWGFEPVVEALLKILPEEIKVSIIAGGLRSKGDQEWNEEFKIFLREHWKHVQERSGQPFDLALLEKNDYEYNTEPACRAVVTVREMDKAKQFSFFSALQRAFYAEGKDITQDKVIVEIAEAEGFEKEKFLALFKSMNMQTKAESDRYKARSMGANVFPSLVIIDTEGHLCVIKGYKDYEEIKKLL